MLKTTPFTEASKASVDSMFALASQTLQGVEQLSTLNLQVIKTSLAEWSATFQAALSVKTPEEFVKLQAAALQAAPQKALAYGRQAREIVVAATEGQRSAAEAQAAEVQARFLEAVGSALQNVPGSENAAALVKSAVAAANNAFDGVNKASKQVFDAVEANVAKVTETAVQSSSTALAKVEA